MKILAKIFAISVFDFICIYGLATIIVVIVYRIADWELNPYLFIASLAFGRILELNVEKLNDVGKQMITHAIIEHMHEFEEDEDDGEED